MFQRDRYKESWGGYFSEPLRSEGSEDFLPPFQSLLIQTPLQDRGGGGGLEGSFVFSLVITASGPMF